MSESDDLPPLRDVIARYGLRAVQLARPELPSRSEPHRRGSRGRRATSSGVTVIEIGPGPGGLTRALLAAGAKRVVAIERDERCLMALDEIARAYPGRLTIVAGDALSIDCGALADGPTVDRRQPSLQYRDAAPHRLAQDRAVAALVPLDDADVPARGGGAHRRRPGLQGLWPPQRPRRLADARPASSSTSRLARSRRRRRSPPRSFTSSRIPEPLAADPAILERVTAAAFGQRRKMLRQSLKTLGVDPQPLLAACGIDGDAAGGGDRRRRVRRARRGVRARCRRGERVAGKGPLTARPPAGSLQTTVNRRREAFRRRFRAPAGARASGVRRRGSCGRCRGTAAGRH